MTDLIKQAKIKNPDEETSEYIPFGADAENVFLKSGKNLEEAIGGIKTNSYFNNIASLKNDTELKIGSVAETLGYYNAGDGGQGKYYIVSSDYEADELTTYTLASGLRAKLVARDGISSKQIGFTSNGSVNSSKLNAILEYCGINGVPFYIDSNIRIDDPIEITTSNTHIIGRENPIIWINIDREFIGEERFYIFRIKDYDLIRNITIENLKFYKVNEIETLGGEPYYIDIISSDSFATNIYFKKVRFSEDGRINTEGLGLITFESCDIYDKNGFFHLLKNIFIIFDKCFFHPSLDTTFGMKATNQSLVEFLGGYIDSLSIAVGKDSNSKVVNAGLLGKETDVPVSIYDITE